MIDYSMPTDPTPELRNFIARLEAFLTIEKYFQAFFEYDGDLGAWLGNLSGSYPDITLEEVVLSPEVNLYWDNHIEDPRFVNFEPFCPISFRSRYTSYCPQSFAVYDPPFHFEPEFL